MHNILDYDVLSVNSLTKDVAQIILKPAKAPLYYEAGQYIEVLHANQSTSPLSIACAPRRDQMLEFHLYHSMKNLQAQDLLHLAQKEKRWVLSGPYGSGTLARLHLDKPILFVARGTGFASIKSLIEALMDLPSRPPMQFYWSVPYQQDFYLLNDIHAWEKRDANFKFIPVLSKEVTDSSPSQPVQEIILRDHPDLSSHQVYAAASRSFIYSLFYTLQKHGLHQEFFYSDVFG